MLPYWKFIVGLALITLVTGSEFERHPNDGWFNNLVHPDWGAIDTHLLRISPTNYSDGVYEPSGVDRPNPFEISKTAFKDNSRNHLGSNRSRNALLVFFGQQLVEEILDAQRAGCPIEFYNIPVPKDHKYNPEGKENLEMPFRRARFDQRTGLSPNNPRQQLNEITPFIDGTLVYGAGKIVEDAIRSFEGGRLAANTKNLTESFPIQNDIRIPFANPPSPRDHVLRPVSRFRRFANPRTHENPFLVALATVWFRYHNFIANKLKKENRNWDDEQIFLAARKRVIAQYQKIVMYEWLPAWLSVSSNGSMFDMSQYPYKGGGKNMYEGYNPNVHPGVSIEFQAAAMRFGHTLVPAGVKTKAIVDGKCRNSERPVKAKFTNKANNLTQGNKEIYLEGIRLCNAFWVPEETVEKPGGMDEIIRGLVYTRSGREDTIFVSDIREDVFGPLDWSRRDLGALNIQRGRDVGLADYNTVRKAFGLRKKEKWEDISKNFEQIIKDLKELYGNTTAPDNLDVFVGGLLETTWDGPGELFQEITLDQFLRIRHGDRFWYENEDNGLFSRQEVSEINNTTFFDVLNEVTGFYNSRVMYTIERENVFLCPKGIPDSNDCQCEDPDFRDGGDNTRSKRKNINIETREVCTPLQHYDYFTGSEGLFVFTILVVILALPTTVAIMCGLARWRGRDLDDKALSANQLVSTNANEFYATEWVGRTAYGLLNSRTVKVIMDKQRYKLMVANLQGVVARMLDLRRKQTSTARTQEAMITRSCDKDYKMMLIYLPGEIDLVLHFRTSHERDSACDRLKAFFESIGWSCRETQPRPENVIWREANTIDDRKHVLAKFFKKVVSELAQEDDEDSIYQGLSKEEQEALDTQLTRTEFADALGLQPQSLFVRNMFHLVDASGDGFVSFEEFKTYFGILCSGDANKKAEMFFKMFDVSRKGKMSKDNYKTMLKSLMELNDTGDTKGTDISSIVDRIFDQMGKGPQGYLTLKEFKKIMFTDAADLWQGATLNLDAPTGGGKVVMKQRSMRHRAQSFVAGYNKQSMLSKPALPERRKSMMGTEMEISPATKSNLLLQSFTRYVDNHSRQIFCVVLYTLITAGIFIERAYFFSVEREHAGLRRICGYGVSITRGAASAIMFTYSCLLLTMCRNSFTYFRETFFNRFIPYDSMHDFHIYVAGLAMFFTVMHIIGHIFNFYHISTQASLDLNCFFREYFRATHELASFQYWAFTTLTGLSGIVLLLVVVVMVVFAMPFARRNLFNYFSATHSLYLAVYILLFMHGSARLVVPPLWGNFAIGPMLIFLVDKLVSISRNKVLLPVNKATLLPSGVINLVFKRPLAFNYVSGQWVRIACPELGKNEYHPFTLTSSPHEDCLSLHIRAVGPWTKNLRRLFETKMNVTGKKGYPKVFVDGPFGESHQDWYKFPVAVLVGGGIGITPFASILKDIAHRVNTLARIPCQKVYFIWVTRTQRSFEWMMDIIKQVEATDNSGFVDVKICITQLKENFDLRTTMLYICEQHFQKIAGLSMFTGLRATTHFGRPKFNEFFRTLMHNHSEVHQIGVFSCGPGAMTRAVNSACDHNNVHTEGPSLIHHYENF